MNVLAVKSPSERMAAFDALPARLRRALARADFPYDPQWVAARLKRGRRLKQLVAVIEARTDRKGMPA